jgi:hypothetical protein
MTGTPFVEQAGKRLRALPAGYASGMARLIVMDA